MLCAATFGLVISGLGSTIHSDHLLISISIVLAGAGVAYIFVRHEMGQRHPVLPIDLLARPTLALATVSAYTAILGSTTLLLSMPFRLQHTYGFGPGEIGGMIAPYAIGSVMVAPPSGMLSDRIPVAVLGTVGLAIAVTALLFLAFLPTAPNYFDIAWRMWLCGAGFGMFLSPNARLVVGAAPIERAAAAGGLLTTTRMFAQACGATLLAALLAMGLGGGPMPALVATGLATFAGLCCAIRLRPSIPVPNPAESEDVQPVT